MLKLDNNLLQELGLGTLPEDQKKAMLQHIYETLELRVGTQLANQMTDKQLEEFERFIDAGGDQNQAQALQWLETNLPNYKQVVNDVFEALKTEIKGMAPQIMASAGSQGASMAPPQDPAQQSVTQPYQQPQSAQAPAPQPQYQPAPSWQQPQPPTPVDPQAVSQQPPAPSSQQPQPMQAQPQVPPAQPAAPWDQPQDQSQPGQPQAQPTPPPAQPYDPAQQAQQWQPPQPLQDTQP